MQNFLLTHVLLALSLFHAAAFGVAVQHDAPAVVVRQVPTANNPITVTQCLQYSQTANFSVIGTNSTYRAAFLQASPVGTFSNAAMLNAAMAALPPLTRNAALNAACGNLTTIAMAEAARNFTQGVVAQFGGIPANPQAVVNGLEVVFCVSAALVFMMGTWGFMS